MKFHLVPVGQAFVYKNETYVKSGPLTASPETDGNNKLIPRSADVTFVNESALTDAGTDDISALPKDEVINTFDAYHKYCLTVLENISTESTEDLQAKLDNYYQDLLASLVKQ